MKNSTTLQAARLALTAAAALSLCAAAQAGDFEDNYPFFNPEQPVASTQPPEITLPPQVLIVAPVGHENPRYTVSTVKSRAMLGEDSGSFWMAQQVFVRSPAAVLAHAEKR